MSQIKVHQAAECVRLMDQEELASLAASLEANGLRDPIIMGRVNGAKTEQLVDGRNRLRACEIAGVEPRFEVMEFADDEAVKAFVADKSEHRNLTKGQQAMRLALLYPEPGKRGRGNKHNSEILKKLDNLGKTRHAAEQRLSQARAVYAYSKELALAVRDGTRKLDEALTEVKAAREALNSQENKIEKLRAEAPDLAELVDEDRMALNEAAAALDQRKAEAAKEEQSKRETIIRVVSAAYNNVMALVPEFIEDVDARLDDQAFRGELLKYMRIETAEEFNSIKAGAQALTRLIGKVRDGDKP